MAIPTGVVTANARAMRSLLINDMEFDDGSPVSSEALSPVATFPPVVSVVSTSLMDDPLHLLPGTATVLTVWPMAAMRLPSAIPSNN